MRLLTKLKKNDRFNFTTLSGRKAEMIACVRFIDEQGLEKLEDELLNFYGCKNNDYSLDFSQKSQLYIADFAIAKDCETCKIFSFKE